MIRLLVRRPIVSLCIVYLLVLITCNIFRDSSLDNLSSRALDEDIQLEAVGMVTGDPEPCKTSNPDVGRWVVPFEVDSVRVNDGEFEPWGGDLLLSWSCLVWEQIPRYGERWSISGVILQTDENEFRGRDYVFANEKESMRKSSAGGSWLIGRCYRGRQVAADLLSLGIEKNHNATAIVHAVLLGYRGQLSPELRELFCSTGTLHVFAISGLHVGIIAVFFTYILRCCGVSRLYWVWFLAPLLISYTIATGGRASAVRACIMMILYYAAPVLSRKADILSTLAFTALFILVISPDQLTNVGFIYSFTVVTGIIIICPPMEQILARFVTQDPMQLHEDRAWMRGLRVFGRQFVGLVSVSTVAWMVSAPLTMYIFGGFAPIAPLSNIFVVPVTLLIVATGCLSIVFGSCSGLFAIAFNHLNLLFVNLLMGALKILSSVPYGSIEMAGISWWVPVVWYMLIAVCVYALFMWARPSNNTVNEGVKTDDY